MVYINNGQVSFDTDTVITVGKFESIHRGHRKLFETVKRFAREKDLRSVVLTFDPHPNKVLRNPAYQPLFTPEERAYMLKDVGIQYLIAYPFDQTFSAQPPEVFCRILLHDLRCRVLVVGEGYRFGKDRAGTAEWLAQEAASRGRRVVVVPDCRDNQQKISSSRIRRLLTAMADANAPEQAARLLGRPFFIMGVVGKGKQIGRTIGFPTLNLQPDADKFLPANGVYITQTQYKNQYFHSVTNIGWNPTINGDTTVPRHVETFLFGFDGEIYGEPVVVEFLRYLRPEIAFDGINALQAQILTDLAAAEQYFARGLPDAGNLPIV